MRRALLYVAAWLAAGVAAVVLASIGVSMVGRQVTADRPSPLSADEVRSELHAGPKDGGVSTVSTLAGPGDPSTTIPPVADDGLPPGVGDDAAAVPSSTPRVTAGPGPPSLQGGATTTTAPPAPAETRSYTLVGGSVTLRFSASGVTVVAATPNAGYSVETESTHDTGMRVRFRSETHESEVEGWWDAGPRDEVREED